MSGRHQWSHRFISLLATGVPEAVRRRGTALARSGAVTGLRVGAGEASASVRGRRPTPFRVSLILPVLNEQQWDTVAAALGSQPLFRARLLSGELPAEAELVFDLLGAALFPRGLGDLVLTCSCPAWDGPCEHVAAALYAVADRLDQDPFLLTAWRGRARHALVAEVRAHSHPSTSPNTFADAAPPIHVAARPLPESAEEFWHAPALPPRPAPRPRPDPPLGAAPDDVAAVLAPLYARLSEPGAAHPCPASGHGPARSPEPSE